MAVQTSNTTAEIKWADHYVAGHLQTDGKWLLQCGDDDGTCGCGWTVTTDPDITEDELDAIVDSHMEEN